MWWAMAGNKHQFTVIVFTELPKSVQFCCAIFPIPPNHLSQIILLQRPSAGAFFARLYRSRDTQNLISDGWCLQDSCKGISRWHSNGQQLLWPQTRARWRGQRGSLHHSWRTPHPGSRWDLPRPPPAVPRCCSATEQGAGCQRGQSVFMDNTQSAFRPQAKPVRAQKMLGGTDGQVRNAVYLYYSLWHAQ